MNRPYFHGGGRIDGEMIRPTALTGMSRSGANDGVYVTTSRSLAKTYASTVDEPTAWLYEVEPLGELVPMPSLVGGPTISYRCVAARIIRRETVSNADRNRYRAAMKLGPWKATE